MIRRLVTVLFSSGLALVGQAVDCVSWRGASQAASRELWDGYVLSVKASPSAREDPENACTAVILNREGKVVFQTTAVYVSLNEDGTGVDVDGDGKPEVVVDENDGGNCCVDLHIVSLWPEPHELATLSVGGAVQFEEDDNGKTVIWVWTPAYIPPRTFAWRVLRWSGKKLVDVTPEFHDQVSSDANPEYKFQQESLTPEKIVELEAVSKPLTEGWGSKLDDIATALAGRALQHVFCRQYDEAIKDLDLWPEASRAEIKKRFADALGREYPEFAARLGRWAAK